MPQQSFLRSAMKVGRPTAPPLPPPAQPLTPYDPTQLTPGPFAPTPTSPAVGPLEAPGIRSQILPTAQNLALGTLRGEFLGPDSNPYLRDLISSFREQADYSRDLLRSRLSPQGLAFSTPAIRMEQMLVDQPLQQMINQLLTSQYQQERGAQERAMGMGPGLQMLPFQAAQELARTQAGTRGVAGTTTGPTPAQPSLYENILGGATAGLNLYGAWPKGGGG